MIVVIDTCVMIAGALGQNCEARILQLVNQDKIQMIYSKDILTEYMLAPTNFILKANAMTNRQIKQCAFNLANTMSNFICNNATKVNVITKGKYLTSDPSDDKLINLAIDGNADYIISINTDVFEKINVKNKKGKEIVAISPYQFINTYNLKSRFR